MKQHRLVSILSLYQDFTENSFLYYSWNCDYVITYNCLIVNDI